MKKAEYRSARQKSGHSLEPEGNVMDKKTSRTSGKDIAAYDQGKMTVEYLSSLDWDDLVRLGTAVISLRNWVLGDLACAVETRYGENNLGRYAAEIGVEYKTLLNYRTLAAQPDRAELTQRQMTAAEAREIVSGRKKLADLISVEEIIKAEAEADRLEAEAVRLREEADQLRPASR
jgi:hypothetical protein